MVCSSSLRSSRDHVSQRTLSAAPVDLFLHGEALPVQDSRPAFSCRSMTALFDKDLHSNVEAILEGCI